MKKNIILLTALALVALVVGCGSPTPHKQGRPLPVFPPKNLVKPVVTGSPVVAQTLSCSSGTWRANGTISGYSYKWQESPNGLTTWTDVGSALINTYVIGSIELNEYLRCYVKATNQHGTSAVVSSATAQVTGAGGAATQLVFTTQPSSATTGSAFVNQPVVKVENASNAVVTTGSDSTINVTMTIQTGGGTLLGAVTKAAVAGVATFTNLEIDTTGSRTLHAAGTLSGPGLVGVNSSSFTVGAPGTANIWVSTTGNDFTCTRSASLIGNPGGGADCGSFSGACLVASANDKINVATGAYHPANEIVAGCPGTGMTTFTTTGTVTVGYDSCKWNGAISANVTMTNISDCAVVSSGSLISTANIWVSPGGSGTNCVRSGSLVTDPGAATDCGSFNAATTIASPGDTVALNCGVYGQQYVTNGPGSAPAIVIKPRIPGCAHFGTDDPHQLWSNPGGVGKIEFDVSYLTVQNVSVLGLIDVGSGATDCINHIPTDHDSFIGGSLYQFSMKGPTNVNLSYTSVGPHSFQNSDGADTQNYFYGCGQTTWAGHAASGLIDHVVMHDTMTSCALCHINGIYFAGDIDGVTVSNSKFLNLAQDSSAIVVGDNSGYDVKNMAFTNDVYSPVCQHDIGLFAGDNADCFSNPTGDIQFQGMCKAGNVTQNVTFTNITVDGHWGLSTLYSDCTDGGKSIADLTGNRYANSIATEPTYYPQDYSCLYVTYSYDVWFDNTGQNYFPCGTGSVSSKNVNYHFTSPGYPNYDYTIGAASSACDFAPIGDAYPSTDFNGAARLQGGHTFVAAGAFAGTACANRTVTNGWGGSNLTQFPVVTVDVFDTQMANFASHGIHYFSRPANVATSGQMTILTANSSAGLYENSPVNGNRYSTALGFLPGNAGQVAAAYSQDEPDLGCARTPAQMASDYAADKALNATLPVVLNLANYVGRSSTSPTCGGYVSYLPDEVIAYMNAADICSFDIYPVNDTYPITDVGQGVINLYSICHPKPVWSYIETVSYNGTNPAPSTTQVKNEVWQAIINGAQGIDYFCWGDLFGTATDACITDGTVGPAITAINARITASAAAINSPSIGDDATSDTGRPEFQFVEKKSGGHTYIFATNTSGSTLNPTFTVPSVTTSTVAVLDESRNVSLTSNTFTDTFTAYATHLYQVT